MKNKLFYIIVTIVTLLSFPKINYGQAPNLGTAADFVLFTSVGAVSNTGISQVTGNVGTNSGLSTAFGNVNGVMHDNDGASAQAATDLLLAYNQLNATVPTFFPAPLLGNGQILNAGVYSIPSPATLNLELILDGQGNANAVFIFQIQGAFSTNAGSRIKLINGAKACNVFWKVEGLVDMATGTSMKGTVVANNAAINLNTGDTLEGRALSTAGAITVSGVLAYTPIGCGSPFLTGPAAANLGTAACYAIFTSIGALANTPISSAIGDVGSNGGGSVTGWTPADVTGTLHPIPDGSTAACATDLLSAYNYLNTLPFDIELLYPAQFGNNLVLTPHTYRMNGSATFTDTLYLNALGNPNAVFVIQINGALSTSTYAKVNLINGAQSQNVFWKVEGAVNINNYSVFRGTIVSNNGAINLVNTGVVIDGRALSTNGAITTAGVAVTIPPGCGGIPSTSITAEPNDQTACAGSSVSFSVAASGTSLTYQWRKGIVNLVNGGNISGATTATLTINPASITDVASNYNVIVSGSAAPSVTSTNVSLVITTSPSITAQPSDLIVCSGGSASFSVAATGSSLTYQWRKGIVNLINGGSISGANSATLSISPVSASDAALNYNVVVSGACLPNDNSNNASLIINTSPSITAQPSNQTACLGASVSFSVAATGTGLTYQWRKGIVNLINGGNISGATSATLTINPISITDVALNYNVVVSGGCLPNDNSNNASLLINTAPIITTQPTDKINCLGSSANFSVSATGVGLTYQWRKGILILVNGGNISGATTSSLTINPVNLSDASSDYNVVIGGSCALSDTSINAILVVNTPPNITMQPTDQSGCAGDIFNFSVTATGVDLTYQWRRGTIDLISGGNIVDATSPTLVINPVSISDVATDYNVVVSGGCPPPDTSIYVSLILSNPNIIAEPTDQSACLGSSVSFSVASTGTGLTYQWRKGIVNLINGGNISGATSATLTINPVSISDVATDYNVVVSGTCAPNDTSIFVALMLNDAPIIITEPTDQLICLGGSASFSVASSGTGLTYQWRKGTVNLVNGGNISGATSATLIINPVSIADVATNYNVVITGGCAPNDTSIFVALILNNPIIITEPIDQTVCAGSSVSFSVAASGTGLTYQWRKGIVNLVDGGNISGATSAVLTINPVSITDVATDYNVVITGACPPDVTSINVSLMLGDPNITLDPADQTACEGSSVSFSVAATGTGLTYQWRKGIVNLINGGNISGATSAILTLNPVSGADAATDYNVIVSGTCISNDISPDASLTINGLPVITSEPTDKSVCVGNAVSFSVAATGTGLTYQWRKGIVNLINGGNISGATSATLSINPVTISDAASNYNVVVSGLCSPDDISNNASLTVNGIPVAIASANGGSQACTGGLISLNAQTVSGATYSWAGPNGYSSIAQNPIISSATAANAGTYSLMISSNSCSSATATIAITVNDCADLSVIKTVSNFYPTIGETVVFTIVATNNGPNNSTGVIVTDILQSGYAYASSAVTKTTYDAATGIWTIGAMASGTSETLVITVTIIDEGNYVNTATISGNEIDGNLANNSSTIETFPKDFFIPEGFSPNGDEINDLFVIRGIGRYPNNTFDIFNRWGDKVFEEASYKSTWNGRATKGLRIGGDELPIGTYFYVLDLGDGTPIYKGTIYLNR